MTRSNDIQVPTGAPAQVPPAPARTADDAPSTFAAVRIVAVPVALAVAAAVCYVQGWIIAGVVLTVLTLACIVIETAIGSLFVKYALRAHANMFKSLAPLLSQDGPRTFPKVEPAPSAKEEEFERLIDETVGFGLTRMAAQGGMWASDLDEAELAALREHVLDERAQTYDWLQGAPAFEEVGVTAQDGVELVAQRLVCCPSSDRWAVLCHGYSGTWGSMLQYARRFAQEGFNLLIPHMRAHGKSGGAYIGMGYLDRRDLVAWTRWLVEGGSAGAACGQIVLLGHSMGAASLCMAAGEDDLPAEVVALVADCGFDSSWHAITGKLAGAGLPVHPTGDLIRLNLMVRRGGYDLAKGDVAGALARTRLPLLVAHGLKDSSVPAHMAGVLYEAAAGPKELLAVPGASHCQSSLAAPDLYWGTVFGFIGPYLR